ncbi:uncharacterized protein LOC135130111 isoform X1 [Zophobas morio]|uniref:uncharacterized protein LOC135130111 isoform X1 n=1 Tax=Zophobas morio TaxID=2755281 RepID=UPI003082888A
MDNDEAGLMPITDDESISEIEEQCLPVNKSVNRNNHNFTYVEHTKTEFVIFKLTLIFSTLAVVILFPLYLKNVSLAGNVYSLLLTNTVLSAGVFILGSVFLKLLFFKFEYTGILKLPFSKLKLFKITLIYFSCAAALAYALDQKRVDCHFQDPMKALVLLFAFLYYFFVCERFMCLRRIFSTTIIITGLFVALDYSLCNKFKCRGYEIQHTSDDSGNWSKQTHAVWTSVYIIGLALFAAFFTVLEQILFKVKKAIPGLCTVSSSVSTMSVSSSVTELEQINVCKKISSVQLVMWLHIFGILIVGSLFWIEFIPQIGKGSNAKEVVNNTFNGIHCHFSNEVDCRNTTIISWLFLFSYTGFVAASIHFLILTQSAVYTVATMSTALPLAAVWWSFVQMVPTENDLVIWKPSITGDLISSLLGLPIVTLGLYFWYKAHMKDCQQFSRISHLSIRGNLIT